MVPRISNPQAFNRYAYGLNNPVKYVDPSGHKACEDENGDCSTPPMPIPQCTDDYCSRIPPEERAREEAAFRHFLNDPAYFISRWVDPEEWDNNPSALYFRRYTENYLHQLPDQIIADASSTLYGDDFVRALDQARQRNVMAARGMSSEDLDSNYPIPVLDVVGIGALPLETATAIQVLVEEVGAPIYVVGGYARVEYATLKDIDYYIEVEYRELWRPYYPELPGPRDFRPNNTEFFGGNGVYRPYIRFVPSGLPDWER